MALRRVRTGRGAALYLAYERHRSGKAPVATAGWKGGLLSQSVAPAGTTPSAGTSSTAPSTPQPAPQPITPQPITPQPIATMPVVPKGPQPLPSPDVPRERPWELVDGGGEPATSDQIASDLTSSEPVYVSPDDLRRGAQVIGGVIGPVLGFINPVLGAVAGAVAKGVATIADLVPPPPPPPPPPPTLGEDNQSLPGYTYWLLAEKGYAQPQPVADYGPSIEPVPAPDFSIGNALDRTWGGASDLFAGGGADYGTDDFSIANALGKDLWL